jgi:bifunctional non-homologous end joining protein LigD
MQIGDREVEIHRRDKVLFPDEGITKGDLVDYYADVAAFVLSHLRDRPVGLERWPDGLDGEGFVQRDTPDHFPDWIGTVEFPRRTEGSFDAPLVESAAALVYLADQAVITPHAYLARRDDLVHPDRMIFDLDPPADTRDFDVVRRAALGLHDLLEDLDLPSWVQTTGSKGFHVVVPLDRGARFDAVRDFATDVARVLVGRDGDAFTLAQRKARRGDRVFLDTLRNTYAATAVTPYAVRARTGAPVATPLDWDEVRDGADPRDWTLRSIPRRLGQKEDPWAGMARHARGLEGRREELDAMLDRAESSGP